MSIAKETGTCQSSEHWDQTYSKLMEIAPWAMLVPAIIISQLQEQTWTSRVTTLALAALAATWVYVSYSRLPRERRFDPVVARVYFVGLLALFVALLSRDTIFVLFVITGFVHAYLLKPWPVGVAGVFGTSVVLNTMTMGIPEPTAGSIGIYVGVIAIQTIAIGAGVVLGEKGMEQHRQREETLAKLEGALEENAGLHAQLVTQAREAGVHDERQRMAGEIHDTLAQGLTGIVTQVQAAQRMWHDPHSARPHVDRALTLAKESLTEARRSVQALRPQELENAQLPDALGELSQRWAHETDVGMTFDVTGDRVPLSPAIEVALFRVAQEALTNVSKHADAARVGVTLSYSGDVVLLDVRDDGTGMKNGASTGFGLNSMRQRIRSVGGQVEVESAPGHGTAISASVPAIVVGAQ